MSVKNIGSKLARGVRQVKAQQESVPPVVEMDEVADVAEEKSPATTATPRGAAKPGANKPTSANTGKSSFQHPDRVWPD